VPAQPFRYRSAEEDSGRWAGFPFRSGDIVISTRSKTGTTWVQMICALLIFQAPDLPAQLGSLSPWLDHLITPRDEVYAQLEAQRHRRFIKTHTPLDGIPVDSRATYLVTARHPLDMIVSLIYQSENIDRDAVRRLTGQLGQPASSGQPPTRAAPRRSLHERVLRWINSDSDPRADMDGLPGVMSHLRDAWGRRGEPNVLLIHYANLSADLEGQMRWLAARLGIRVPEVAWPDLVKAATFESMRSRASQLIPSPAVMKDHSAFFRRGRGGAGRELLTDDELARYHARAAELAPPDLLTWLHAPVPGPAAG